jgi:hypothetical protein
MIVRRSFLSKRRKYTLLLNYGFSNNSRLAFHLAYLRTINGFLFVDALVNMIFTPRSGIINPLRSFNCNCIRELEKITPKFQTGATLGPGRLKRVPEAGIEPARPLLAKGF